MKQRFSKSALRAHIQRRMDQIQLEHDFDRGDGTHQLRGNADKAVDYGALRAMESLADEWELGCIIQRRRDIGGAA